MSSIWNDYINYIEKYMYQWNAKNEPLDKMLNKKYQNALDSKVLNKDFSKNTMSLYDYIYKHHKKEYSNALDKIKLLSDLLEQRQEKAVKHNYFSTYMMFKRDAIHLGLAILSNLKPSNDLTSYAIERFMFWQNNQILIGDVKNEFVCINSGLS